jgi:hypothetical protein
MKTKFIFTSMFLSLLFINAQAQYYANNNVNYTYSYSENIDLRAVASVFGDSQNLEDFENRLNDPRLQISNLDLNNDGRVDYLRVVESLDRNAHLVIIQSVLNFNSFQDVATIEIERDFRNNISLQVVGNQYIFGANYIYEPFFNRQPSIFVSLYAPYYRPYVSRWNWNNYPRTYTFWRPIDTYRYRNNIAVNINFNNNYRFVNSRNCNNAVVLYKNRSNAFIDRNPSYQPRVSNTSRNTNDNSRVYHSNNNVTINRNYSNDHLHKANNSRNYNSNDSKVTSSDSNRNISNNTKSNTNTTRSNTNTTRSSNSNTSKNIAYNGRVATSNSTSSRR